MKENQFNETEFKKKFNEIYPKIKNGLYEGKKLYEDGLLNLDEKELIWLVNNVHSKASMIVFLVIVIQSFPGNSCELEDSEGHRLSNIILQLVMIAGLEKHGLAKCTTKSNKISEDYDLLVRQDLYQEFKEEKKKARYHT